ncbi:hypothetical protein ACSFA3_17350 [Variovorax sp. RHLX14]|uniref:hypothetical protein n=1 Tax=Variovorax sp. RHLX14 TaxID=1259731 RepID=UPI003F44A91F
MTFGLANTKAEKHPMSIISTKAGPSNPPTTRSIHDAKAPTRQATSFLKPLTAAEVLSSGQVTRAEHVAATTAGESTPFKDLATKLCGAGDKHRALLAERGIKNPAYLGINWGSFVYSNPKNSELVVRNLRIKPGLSDLRSAAKDAQQPNRDGILNMQNFGNLCQVKKDGRIILDGETVTKDHPKHAQVLKALDTLLYKISTDTLDRSSLLAANPKRMPWVAGAQGNDKYVD